MSNDYTAEVVARLLVSLVFSFIVRPLALIYGLNLLLSAAGLTELPYTLLVYFGVMLVMLAINLRVVGKE